jgi:hypothetical protein
MIFWMVVATQVGDISRKSNIQEQTELANKWEKHMQF